MATRSGFTWQPGKIVMYALNYLGAISSIVAFGIYLLKDSIGPVGVSILSIAGFLTLFVYLALTARQVIGRVSTTLLDEVGAQQRDTIATIQKEFIAETSSQAAHIEQLNTHISSIREMARLSLKLRQIEQLALRSTQSERVISAHLYEALSELAYMFSALSGSKCRVCVKMVYDHTDTQGQTLQAVRTIARSNTVQPDPPRDPDLVKNNTDFTEIYMHRQKYWFCGDIHDKTRVANYSNSSHTYPYRSVIVWPLRTFDATIDRPATDGELGNIVGFLCLDSEDADVFSEDRELQLGWWFVDVLAGNLENLIQGGRIST